MLMPKVAATTLLAAVLVTGCGAAKTALKSGADSAAVTATSSPASSSSLSLPATYKGGLIELTSAAAGQQPAVSATDALSAYKGSYFAGLFTHYGYPEPSTQLAVYTNNEYANISSDGSADPIYKQRLVWVVEYLNVAAHRFGPGGVATASDQASDAPAPVGYDRGDILIFVDAQTGQALQAITMPAASRDSTPVLGATPPPSTPQPGLPPSPAAS